MISILLSIFCYMSTITASGKMPLMRVDPKYTSFVHPALMIAEIEGKGEGIITTKPIKFGQVLMVDSPLLGQFIKTNDIQAMLEFINKIRSGRYPKEQNLFDQMITSNKTMKVIKQVIGTKYPTITDQQWLDIARVAMNDYSGFLFPAMSKINHGFPTNVLECLSPTGEHNKIIIIATDDIKVGEELQYDYFGLITAQNAPSIDEIERLENDIQGISGVKIDKHVSELVDKIHKDPDGTSSEIMRERIHEIYSNGIGSNSRGKIRIFFGKENVDSRMDMFMELLQRDIYGECVLGKTPVLSEHCDFMGKEFCNSMSSMK